MHMYGNVTSATLIKTGHEFHQFHSRFVHVISYLDDTESIKSIQFTELPESYQYFKYYYINSATLKLDIYSTYRILLLCNMPAEKSFHKIAQNQGIQKTSFQKIKNTHNSCQKIKTPKQKQNQNTRNLETTTIIHV